jgi:Flp pilus assembly pilin Flp
MVALRTLLVKLVKDETGTEVVEYALLTGLIVVATLSAMQAMGTKVLARWEFLSDAPW